MSLDVRLLRPFTVLADELHFGRAAARLHVSQPALSQQVKRLELQLGVVLFERTRSTVELTAAGTEILPGASAAVEAAATVEAIATDHAGGQRGVLRIGLSPGVHELSRRLLHELRAGQPALRVRVSQDNTGVLCAGVASGALDVAIGFCPETMPGTIAERLLEEPAVLAVATGRPLEREASVDLAALDGERFALVDADGGPGYNRAVVELCRAAGFQPDLESDPQGPMAWETGVRSRGSVGLTTRLSAVSTERGIALVDLSPPALFAIDLLAPAGPGGPASAETFRDLAHTLARQPWP